MYIKKYSYKSVFYLNNSASMSSVISIKEPTFYARSNIESHVMHQVEFFSTGLMTFWISLQC